MASEYEQKARNNFKSGKIDQVYRDTAPLEQQSWYQDIMKAMPRYYAGVAERQLTKAAYREKIEQALGPAPKIKEPKPTTPAKWVKFLSILGAAQSLSRTYAPTYSNDNPFGSKNGSQPDPQPDDQDTSSNSEGIFASLRPVSEWIFSNFYPSAAPPEPAFDSQSNADSAAHSGPNDWFDLSWPGRSLLGDTDDHDYMPSAWPFQGGEAAPARRRHYVTRRPNGHVEGQHGHHHKHRHHHNHSEPAPAPLVHEILGNIVTRRELAIFIMEAKNLDPYALYNTSDSPSAGRKEIDRRPGIDLYIDSQTFSVVSPSSYQAEIADLPNVDKIYWDMIDSIKEEGAKNITRGLSHVANETYHFGQWAGGTYTLKSISMAELFDIDPIVGVRDNDNPKADTTTIGYVLDVDDPLLHRDESYIIAPAHHPPLIRIPTDPTGQHNWIKKHQHLFFNPRKESDRPYLIRTKTIEEYANIYLVFEDVGKYIADNVVDAFKYSAFGETRREKIIHRMQWVVPFYSAWLAFKRHEYTEAVVRTVLDVLALAGGPFARAMKAAGILTNSGKLVTAAKYMKKLSYLDGPGQVDNLHKNIAVGLTGQVAGRSGRTFAGYLADELKQDDDKGTLNIAVGAGYSGRDRDKARIDAVVRNRNA